MFKSFIFIYLTFNLIESYVINNDFIKKHLILFYLVLITFLRFILDFVFVNFVECLFLFRTTLVIDSPLL